MENEEKIKQQKEKIEKEFVPYEIAVALKNIGFDKLCIASYYTDDKENDLGSDGDYRKQFVGLEFAPQDSWGAVFEPHFIKNTESTYYVSAPLYQQVFDWFEDVHNIKCWVEWGSEYLQLGYYQDSTGLKQYINNDTVTKKEAEILLIEKLIEIVK